MPFWHYSDAWILTDVLGYASSEGIDTHVIPIDLGAKPNGLRPPLVALLEAVCQPIHPDATKLDCGQRRLSLPSTILLDILFAGDSGDPRLVARLRDDVVALRQAGVTVYAAVDPGAPRVAAIYDAMTGIGHTEINVVPLVPTGFAWYKRTEDVDGTNVQALPLSIKSIDDDARPSEEGTTLIPIGPHATYALNYRTVPGVVAAFRDDAKLARSTKPGRFFNETLVVGNGATDTQLPGDRTGFEVVAWAISDWFADPRAARRLAAKPDTTLMLALTAGFSIFAAIVFVYVFPKVRTRKFGYAIAFVAASAASFLGIAVFEFISLTRDYAFDQLSLVVVGTLTASGVAARASADGVKHERFLKELWSRSNGSPDDRFDIFISYARDPENARWVHENVYLPLSRVVNPDGTPLKIFFDRESITTGMDWYDRIVRSIQGTRIFLPVYSRGYFNRWFCIDELELALLRRGDDPKFILPVTRIGYKLPRRYASIQALDTNSPLFADDLVRTLTHSLEGQQ